MMIGVLNNWLVTYFRNMVGSTRQVHYHPEVGQGSDTQGTATMQDTPPTFPPFAPLPHALVMAPMVAPLMIGAEQLQQLLGAFLEGMTSAELPRISLSMVAPDTTDLAAP